MNEACYLLPCRYNFWISFIMKSMYLLLQAGSSFRPSAQYPVALVLAPTRELACQIYDEARKV